MKTSIAVFMLLMLAAGVACRKHHPTEPEPDQVWGGDHVRMVVTVGGADVEYDCAYGSVDEPISPDPGGAFDVAGTFVMEAGGPVRSDYEPNVLPARYSGTIDNDHMSLTVTLIDGNREVGSYSLTLGDAGHVVKCLASAR